MLIKVHENNQYGLNPDSHKRRQIGPTPHFQVFTTLKRKMHKDHGKNLSISSGEIVFNRT